MAIQQHPVPQDISNYKFRLIGDMTIKQFAALGISIVLSVMTYSAPLPFFFKYPISFIILLTGVGTAFVPFQGRTLDVWIVAFIKSIYSPTQYIWKHGHQEVVTTPTADNSAPQTPVVNISAPATDIVPTTTQLTDIPLSTPQLQTEPPAEENNLSQPTGQQPVAEVSMIDDPQSTTPDTPPITYTKSIIEKTVINSEPIATKSEASTTDSPQLATSNVIPSTTESSPANTTQEPTSQSEIRDLKSDISSLPIPFTPTTPNTLVGLTLTPQGQTLDGVLVEIKNQSITMRATKSNKLGQFLFVRPLENGLYQILAEKEGFNFESYSIQLTGEIINPLRIQAI